MSQHNSCNLKNLKESIKNCKASSFIDSEMAIGRTVSFVSLLKIKHQHRMIFLFQWTKIIFQYYYFMFNHQFHKSRILETTFHILEHSGIFYLCEDWFYLLESLITRSRIQCDSPLLSLEYLWRLEENLKFQCNF